ncbi:MAG: tetratricopeptide repeat protein [Casimicrobiaceae bacterium]
MSSYASGTKLTELSLTDEPALDAKPPVAKDGPAPAGAPLDPNIHRSNHSTVVKAALLKLADEPTEAVEIQSIEAGERLREGKASRDRDSKNNDEFVAEAAREFEAGTFDQPLWAKAVELAGNDAEAAKPAYLRARATALRVVKRNKRAEEQARRASELAQEEKDWGGAPTRSGSHRRRNLLIGGAVGGVALVAGFLLLFPASEPPNPVDVAKPAAQAPAVPKAKAATPAAQVPERLNISNEDFAKKVADFKAAGNWNVLVLYGVEWTRKLPDSADAWNELGMGYMKLRQFSEAQEATAQAAQLAPNNFETWQRLGEIDMALQQPVEALAAYEKAAASNGRDVTSLVQIGSLNVQLGHLPEAKVAFARALDVSPMDMDALCGAASVAQKEGRAKDADAIARQLKAADLSCREAVTVAPVSVPATAAANKKPPLRPTR